MKPNLKYLIMYFYIKSAKQVNFTIGKHRVFCISNCNYVSNVYKIRVLNSTIIIFYKKKNKNTIFYHSMISGYQV